MLVLLGASREERVAGREDLPAFASGHASGEHPAYRLGRVRERTWRRDGAGGRSVRHNHSLTLYSTGTGNANASSWVGGVVIELQAPRGVGPLVPARSR